METDTATMHQDKRYAVILEVLVRRRGKCGNVRHIASDVQKKGSKISEPSIAMLINKLYREGLVEPVGESDFCITEAGERYLAAARQNK